MYITSVTSNASINEVAYGTKYGMTYRLDATTFKIKEKHYNGDFIGAMTYSHCGTFLYSASDDGTIEKRNTHNGCVEETIVHADKSSID